MKKIRAGLWIAAVAVVFAVVLLKPQYALDAAKAIMLVIGENQCICE